MRRNRGLLLLIALLSVSTLVMAACGSDPAPTPPTGNGDDGGGCEGCTLVTEGHLTIGSDIPYPPFEFNDDSGALTGFDVELVREIASRIGLENTDDDWLSVNFDTIFQQQQAGQRFDIIVAAVTAYAPEGSEAATTVAERGRRVDFTVPYYDSLQSLAVDTEASPDITGVDSLPEGGRVAVQRGTTGAFYAEGNLTSSELVSFAQSPQMYQALQAGQVVAVFNDLPTTLAEIENKPGLEVVEQIDTGEQYGIGVNKENTALRDAIDAALEEMFADGTYAEIFKTYFPDQELPDYASE
jgi:polar amino acid transport system substrate-binding protein